jgi:threonine dehydratase
VLTSRTVDSAPARRCSSSANLQRIGAFKFRGAFNAVSQLSPANARGVLSFSSGNHAQAVALAGRLLGVRVTIACPRTPPGSRSGDPRTAPRSCSTTNTRKRARRSPSGSCASAASHDPADHPQIIAGQGTAAKELIEDAGKLDYVFVPVSGGGLISGCAVAASHLSPGVKVIGVEPEAGDDATRSFRTKTLQTCYNPDTIADGARTHALGKLTFPLILRYVSDMVTVRRGARSRHVLPVGAHEDRRQPTGRSAQRACSSAACRWPARRSA